MLTLNRHLLIGIALALPFFILNALVASRAPIIKILRLNILSNGYEQILILGLLSLVLIGGIVSLYPAVKDRRMMIVNIITAVLFIGFSIMAGYGLGEDIYHCDILKIPNCD